MRRGRLTVPCTTRGVGFPSSVSAVPSPLHSSPSSGGRFRFGVVRATREAQVQVGREAPTDRRFGGRQYAGDSIRL